MNDTDIGTSVLRNLQKEVKQMKYEYHHNGEWVIQQWECIVLELRDDCVHCQLHDLTDESNPDEFAEVLLSEFNEYDRPILSEGSVFYWSIYRDLTGREVSSIQITSFD